MTEKQDHKKNKQTTGPKHKRDLNTYTKTDKRLYTRFSFFLKFSFLL